MQVKFVRWLCALIIVMGVSAHFIMTRSSNLLTLQQEVEQKMAVEASTARWKLDARTRRRGYSRWALTTPLAPWNNDERLLPDVLACNVPEAMNLTTTESMIQLYVGGHDEPVNCSVSHDRRHPVLYVVDFMYIERNIFHQLVYHGRHYWCGMKAALLDQVWQNNTGAQENGNPRFLFATADRSRHANKLQTDLFDLVSGFAFRNDDKSAGFRGVAQVYQFYKIILVSSAPFNVMYLSESMSLQRKVVDPLWTQILHRIHHRLHTELDVCGISDGNLSAVHPVIPQQVRGGVTLLLRNPSTERRLVDDTLGTEEALTAAFRHVFPAGVVVAAVAEDLRSALCAVRNASVVVGVHGANLVNMLWMPPGITHVVEVSMRLGWCGYPHIIDYLPKPFRFLDDMLNMTTSQVVALDPFFESKPNCSKDGAPYYKADYFNMAPRIGHGYHEYANVTFVSPFHSGAAIHREFVYVNSVDLALKTKQVWERSLIDHQGIRTRECVGINAR